MILYFSIFYKKIKAYQKIAKKATRISCGSWTMLEPVLKINNKIRLLLNIKEYIGSFYGFFIFKKSFYSKWLY